MITFISGPIDISQNMFIDMYKDRIDRAVERGDSFIVCDSNGVDNLAQIYLHSVGQGHKTTIYHIGKKPRNKQAGMKLIGGFKDHESKDSACTLASDCDILWYRSVKQQKELFGNKYIDRISGTQKNELRRLSI